MVRRYYERYPIVIDYTEKSTRTRKYSQTNGGSPALSLSDFQYLVSPISREHAPYGRISSSVGSLGFNNKSNYINKGTYYLSASSSISQEGIFFYKVDLTYREERIADDESYDVGDYGGGGYGGTTYYHWTANITTMETSERRGTGSTTVIAEEGTYPTNGRQGNYWYIMGGVVNRPPIISGSDTDLGGKVSDFDIEYVVTDPDASDEIEVSYSIDNVVKQAFKLTTQGMKNVIKVNINDLEMGRHQLVITARDKQNETSTRKYDFSKTNSIPVFYDENNKELPANIQLNAKNTAFSFKYKVKDLNNDPVKISENINGVYLREIQNAHQQEIITLTITQEQINELVLDKENVIEVKADDGRGGINYIRLYFTRTNKPPIISGTDSNLGDKVEPFSHTYSATDLESDPITLSVHLDTKTLKEPGLVEDNKLYTLDIEQRTWFQVSPGQHNLRIEAVDDKGGKSERNHTFTRVVTKCGVQMAKPYETDAKANNIVVTPSWRVADGAIGKIEACNNAFDDNPTWEDITEMALANRKFYFTNTTKTAGKWGVDVRVIIERDKAKSYSYIYGFGGSFS